MRSKNFNKFIAAVKESKGSYPEVRWRYGLSISPTREIDNSAKASFSRMKKFALKNGLVKEVTVTMGQLTDEEYLNFLVYDSNSRALLDARMELIPKIFERGYYKYASSQKADLKKIEDDLLNDAPSVKEVKTAQLELHQSIHKIYDALIDNLPALKRGLSKSDFEYVNLFIGKILSYITEEVRGYGIPTLIEFIHEFVKHPPMKTLFSNALKEELHAFEDLLTCQITVTKDLKRKGFFASFNQYSRYAWEPELRFSSLNRNQKLHEVKKEEALGKLGLHVADLKFIEREYKSWTLEELNKFLQDVLHIPYDSSVQLLTLNPGP